MLTRVNWNLNGVGLFLLCGIRLPIKVPKNVRFAYTYRITILLQSHWNLNSICKLFGFNYKRFIPTFNTDCKRKVFWKNLGIKVVGELFFISVAKNIIFEQLCLASYLEIFRNGLDFNYSFVEFDFFKSDAFYRVSSIKWLYQELKNVTLPNAFWLDHQFSVQNAHCGKAS